MKRASTAASIFAVSAALVCGLLFVIAARSASAGEAKFKKNQKTVKLIPSLDGHELFKEYCATCHGLSGKGDGPVASVLDTPVADLTTIAKRNGGVFPIERVRGLIAGDDVIKAHGTREMPIWGPIFHQIEDDRDFGNIRLDNVTKYVKSLQEK